MTTIAYDPIEAEQAARRRSLQNHTRAVHEITRTDTYGGRGVGYRDERAASE